MQLLRLELSGFKSFGDKINISFARNGISVIVGPNGCGKSNIVDAIRWCLGEQSAKHLRGGHMQDVIFSGSLLRQPVSMARAALFFSNPHQNPNSKYRQFSEINVMRKLFRNGDSEYLINNVPSRLLDVRELFMDTGTGGAQGYAIIEQDRVARLITGKPEDRRFVIEEAAGVLKFKQKKADAEKRLAVAQENMLRVDDILKELLDQESTLAHQSQEAEAFIQLRSRKEHLERCLLALKWQEAQEKAKFSHQELKNLEQEIIDSQVQIKTLETNLSITRFSLEEKERKREEQQIIIDKAKQAIHSTETQRKLDSQAQDNLALWNSKDEEEQESYQKTLSELEKEITHLKTSILLVEEKITLQKQTAEAFDQKKNLFEETQRPLKNKLEALNRTRVTHAISQAELETELKNIRHNRQENQKNEQDGHEEAKKWERENKGCLLALANKEEEFDLCREEKFGLSEARETLLSRLEDARSQESKLIAVQQKKREHTSSLQGRLELLTKALENLDDFDQSTAKLLQYFKENADQTHRLGFISSFTAAVSINENTLPVPAETLEHWSHILIFRSFEKLDDIREICLKLGCDRPEFIFLDLCSHEKKIQEENQLNAYLQHPVFEELSPFLSKIILQASPLSAFPDFTTNVTLIDNQGTILTPSGTLILVSPKSSTVISRYDTKRQEIKKLTAEKELLDEEIAQNQDELFEQGNDTTELKNTLEDKEIRIQELSLKEVEHQKNIERYSEIIVQNEKRLKKYVEQQEEKNTVLTKNSQRLSELEKIIPESEMQRIDLEQEIQVCQKNIEKQHLFAEELAAEQQELLLNESLLSGEKTVLNKRFLEKQNEQKNILEKKIRLQKELLERDRQAEKLKHALNESNSRLPSLLKNLNESETELIKIKEAFETEKMVLFGQGEQLKTANKSLAECHKKEQRFRLQMTQATQESENIVERLRENDTVDPEKILDSFDTTSFNPEEEVPRLKKLKAELAGYEKVNLAAREEYQKLRERLDFLEEQKNDLNESMESLQNSILQMTQESQKRFRHTFKLVNQQFAELFPLLFGGGAGHLELTNQENISETGIDIIAKPPGKTAKNLTLLSGGEKALTALALVFSIFMIKPSPFCVLDEVDAPLDDANIGRFCRLALEISKTSQVIIITHNRKTMEIADRMFGITMDEPGVSKVVSVDFSNFEQSTANH